MNVNLPKPKSHILRNIIIIGSLIIFIAAMILIVRNCSPSKSSVIAIEPVINEKIFFPFISITQNKAIFLGDKGIKYYSYDLNKKEKKPLLREEILGAVNAIYKPDGNESIVIGDYPSKYIKLYNFTDEKTASLNNNIGNIAWDKTKDKIYYIYSNLANHITTLNISNPDGSDWKKLIDLPESILAYKVYALDNELIYTDYLTVSKLNLTTNQTEKMFEAKLTSGLLISPDGEKIAYNISDLNGTKIFDQKSHQAIQLKEEINIESSVFSTDNNIYYLKNLDTLTKIDQDGNLTNINLNKLQVNVANPLDEPIQNLTLSQDNKILYFTYNNILYKIVLQK